MSRTTPILAATAALLVATAPLALAAQSATFDTTVSITNVAGAITYLDQASAWWYDDGVQHVGVLISDAGNAKPVTYQIHAFDRNGESDLLADHDVRIAVYGPTDTGAPSSTPLALSSGTAASEAVAVSGCGAPSAGAADWAIPTGDLVDSSPLNGDMHCTFTVTYNAGAGAKPGHYRIQASISDKGLQNVVHSLDIHTVVYDVLQVETGTGSFGGALGTGAIDFGSVANHPTAAAATGNLLLAARNVATAPFGVVLDFTDLALVGAASPTQAESISREFFGVTYAVDADPNAGGASLANSAGNFDASNVRVDEGQAAWFQVQLQDYAQAGNDVLSDGAYQGIVTLTVQAHPDEEYYQDGATFSQPLSASAGDRASTDLSTGTGPDGLGSIVLDS